MGVSKSVDHPDADRSHGDLLRQWIRRRRLGPVVKALFGLSDAMLSLVLFAAGAGAIAAMPVAGLLPLTQCHLLRQSRPHRGRHLENLGYPA